MVALVIVALTGWVSVALLLATHGKAAGRVDGARAGETSALRGTIAQLQQVTEQQATRIHQLDAMLDAYRAEGLKNPGVLEPAAPVLPDPLAKLPQRAKDFLDGYEDAEGREEAEAYMRTHLGAGVSVDDVLAELQR